MRVDPFFIDEAPVTNKEYGKFVRATYYETEAEKFGWSFVLSSFLPNAEELESAEVDPEAVGAIRCFGSMGIYGDLPLSVSHGVTF